MDGIFVFRLLPQIIPDGLECSRTVKRTASNGWNGGGYTSRGRGKLGKARADIDNSQWGCWYRLVGASCFTTSGSPHSNANRYLQTTATTISAQTTFTTPTMFETTSWIPLSNGWVFYVRDPVMEIRAFSGREKNGKSNESDNTRKTLNHERIRRSSAKFCRALFSYRPSYHHP